MIKFNSSFEHTSRDALAGHRASCSLEHIWIEIPILCESEPQFTPSYFPLKLSVLVSTCKKWNTPECILNMCATRKLLTERVKIFIISLTPVRTISMEKGCCIFSQKFASHLFNQAWGFEIPTDLMRQLQWQMEQIQVLLILLPSSYLTAIIRVCI